MKGLIVGGGVDTPLYQVKLIHDTTFHDKEVNDIQATIAKINERLAVAEKNWVDAVIERDALPTSATQSELAVVQDKIDVAYNQKTRYAALIKIANDRLSFIESHKVADKTVDAWCSDYTLGLSGEVGLCEQLMTDGTKRYTIYPDAKDPNSPHNADFQADVSGKLAEAQALVAKHEAQKAIDEAQLKQMKSLYDAGRLPKAQALVDAVRISFAKLQATLGKLESARKQVSAIQRGIAMLANYNGRKSAYIAQNDGRQVETLTTPPRTWFINAAREPWRYKWKPQFMAAKVVANDTAANTLDVSFEQPKLGLAKLTVHKGMKSSGIVADYMSMGGSGIYEVGDDVMVEFPSFNPAMPIINGFSVNPRAPYLWADSQIVAVDYVRQIRYLVNPNSGIVYIYKDGLKTVSTSVFDSTKISSTNKILFIGISPTGYFISTFKELYSYTYPTGSVTVDVTANETRFFFNVDENLNVVFSNEVVSDLSTSIVEQDSLTGVSHLGTGDVIAGKTATEITFQAVITDISFTKEVTRIDDYNYALETMLSYNNGRSNVTRAARVLDAVSIQQVGQYMTYTPSDYPVGTFGYYPSRYAEGIISRYDSTYMWDIDISATANLSLPSNDAYFMFSASIYDDGSYNANGFYNELLKIYYDVFIAYNKHVDIGFISPHAGRPIMSETWYDKKGKQARQGVTTTPRWKLCKPTDAGATILTNGKYVCPAPIA